MGDIAAVFGWSPAVMDQMDVPELMSWHAIALARFKAMNG